MYFPSQSLEVFQPLFTPSLPLRIEVEEIVTAGGAAVVLGDGNGKKAVQGGEFIILGIVPTIDAPILRLVLQRTLTLELSAAPAGSDPGGIILAEIELGRGW